MRARTSYAALALFALAGCVRADPVAPDMVWCQAPVSLDLGDGWEATVTMCVKRAPVTEVRR